jgi:DNA repair protein RadC
MTTAARPILALQPRERLAREGAAALTTVELMAILLGTGRAGQNVVQVALDAHDAVGGSLRRLARQPIGTLGRMPGVGLVKATRLLAALELGHRMARESRPIPTRIHCPEDVARLVGDRLRDLDVEEFHVIIVSTQRDVIREVLVSRGTLNSSLVHPREVFRTAIVEGAAAVFLAHNHPSGDPTPSPEDRIITAQMIEAGRLLGIPVLDHVIVAADRWTSFATLGAL